MDNSLIVTFYQMKKIIIGMELELYANFVYKISRYLVNDYILRVARVAGVYTLILWLWIKE